MRKRLERAVVGWRVMATVTDKIGTALRPISRVFNVRQAADEYMEMARSSHDDAYVQAVEKIDRIQAGILASDKV